MLWQLPAAAHTVSWYLLHVRYSPADRIEVIAVSKGVSLPEYPLLVYGAVESWKHQVTHERVPCAVCRVPCAIV